MDEDKGEEIVVREDISIEKKYGGRTKSEVVDPERRRIEGNG